jgi:hypothetical protein
VKREEARALYSDYLEDALTPATRDALQAYLAQEPDAAAELISLERTLSLLHRLPEREPSLDLWRELTPEIEAFRAERRLSLPARLRMQWAMFLSSLSEGVILWTHALAHRAHHHLGPNLHPERERR